MTHIVVQVFISDFVRVQLESYTSWQPQEKISSIDNSIHDPDQSEFSEVAGIAEPVL